MFCELTDCRVFSLSHRKCYSSERVFSSAMKTLTVHLIELNRPRKPRWVN